MSILELKSTKRLGTVAFIFVLVWLTHYASVGPGPTDSVWTIHTAMNILKEGSTNLDSYREIIPQGDYRVESINGHLYSRLPIGPALLALPIVFVIDQYPGTVWPSDLYGYLKHNPPGSVVMSIEKLVASMVVALTAVLIYIIATRYLKTRYSLLVTATFAYGTSAWSTASMALWSHGPSMLFLTLALLLFLNATDSPHLVQYASLPVALSYIMRPSNVIPVLVWTLFVITHYRQWIVRYILWAIPVVALFLAYNLLIYHAWLSPLYRADILGYARNIPEALAGTLVSPSRGLFIFSPILVLIPYAIYAKRRLAGLEPHDYAIFLILILHWVLISLNWSWWGGWAFGPRLFTDMVPYLIYILLPAFAQAPRFVGWRKFAYSSTLAALILISSMIHFRGATNIDVYKWNVEPENIDTHTERLWDWGDVQFLRGLSLRQSVPLSPLGGQFVHVLQGNEDRPKTRFFNLGFPGSLSALTMPSNDISRIP